MSNESLKELIIAENLAKCFAKECVDRINLESATNTEGKKIPLTILEKMHEDIMQRKN